jgi:hypothetical protein
MPPDTFPVATSTSRLGTPEAATPSPPSPGIEPAATWSSAALQLDGRLGGKSTAPVEQDFGLRDQRRVSLLRLLRRRLVSGPPPGSVQVPKGVFQSPLRSTTCLSSHG